MKFKLPYKETIIKHKTVNVEFPLYYSWKGEIGDQKIFEVCKYFIDKDIKNKVIRVKIKRENTMWTEGRPEYFTKITELTVPDFQKNVLEEYFVESLIPIEDVNITSKYQADYYNLLNEYREVLICKGFVSD